MKTKLLSCLAGGAIVAAVIAGFALHSASKRSDRQPDVRPVGSVEAANVASGSSRVAAPVPAAGFPDGPVAPAQADTALPPELAKWDLNGDGRLDFVELEALRREVVRERREQLERTARAAAEARRVEIANVTNRFVPRSMLERYDLNRNGLMDPEEWAAYYEDLERLRGEKLGAQRQPGELAAPAALGLPE